MMEYFWKIIIFVVFYTVLTSCGGSNHIEPKQINNILVQKDVVVEEDKAENFLTYVGSGEFSGYLSRRFDNSVLLADSSGQCLDHGYSSIVIAGSRSVLDQLKKIKDGTRVTLRGRMLDRMYPLESTKTKSVVPIGREFLAGPLIANEIITINYKDVCTLSQYKYN